MRELYIKTADDMLLRARTATRLIMEIGSMGSQEYYARQAELYTGIAEAYIKMASDQGRIDGCEPEMAKREADELIKKLDR